ncbi:MAG: response regulator transcription factor [Planctomycetes bacterium]|jgi:DNA-binding NarL/FixJ family response regulator|nr:response regulator transcription factor [Planctomycetota bacterium]
MTTRILLVDDHQILREGLRSLLETQPDMKIVGEAGEGTTALQLVRTLRPDVVIMDVNMEGMDGIEVTRRIKREYPETRVLALSMYLRSGFVSEMFKSGASGYLLKENAFVEVVQAIRTVLAGQKYACAKVAGLLVDQYVQSEERASARTALTERETEVTRLLARGKSTKEIALITGSSIKTIDARRRRILKKLGLNSLAELVVYAIREHLIEVDDQRTT